MSKITLLTEKDLLRARFDMLRELAGDPPGAPPPPDAETAQVSPSRAAAATIWDTLLLGLAAR
jgi:hypothetical protein